MTALLRRLPATLGSLAAVLLVAAPAAAAATRYATPTGASSGSCTADAPCALSTAISGAASGDEIVVEPGDYSVGSLSATVPLNIHGVAGQARPRIVGSSSSAGVFSLKNPGTTLSHLYVQSTGSTQAIEFQGGVIDDVVLVGAATDTVKLIGAAGGTVLRDAVVRNTSSGNAIKLMDGSGTNASGSIALRNVTAVADGSGYSGVLSSVSRNTATAMDLIARGQAEDLDASGGHVLTISYSNFRPGLAPGVTDAGHNQSADPLFADAAAGDYHLAAGSPAIDAGALDSLSGSIDPDGNPRVLGSAPDIGAFETAGGQPAAGGDGGDDPGTLAAPAVSPGDPSGLPLVPLTDPMAGLDLPVPRYGRTLALAPAAGRIFVQAPGHRRFVVLGTAATVPVGSLVNAKAGAVRLVSARDANGTPQGSVFAGSTFAVGQQKGDTVLSLRGGSFSSCPRRGAHGAAKASIARRRVGRHAVIRQLWGRDHGGRFQSRGRFAAALVRGTTWLTQDRCDGTLIRVTQGTVTVRNLVTGRRVTVRAGHSYLARTGR